MVFSKLAPKAATSIPWMKLCTAMVVALEEREILDECLVSMQPYYYSNSKVVLGYLNNKSRMFTKVYGKEDLSLIHI